MNRANPINVPIVSPMRHDREAAVINENRPTHRSTPGQGCSEKRRNAPPVAYSGKLRIGFGMVGLLVLAGALDSDAKRLLTRSRPGHAHPTLEAST